MQFLELFISELVSYFQIYWKCNAHAGHMCDVINSVSILYEHLIGKIINNPLET